MAPGWFFMVPGGSPWYFMIQDGLSWFMVGYYDFYCSSIVSHGSRFGFHGSRWVFMVPGQFSWFQVSFHGSRSVFMVPGRFSWFFMVQGWFFHIEKTIKLYSGLAIQSRPCPAVGRLWPSSIK